MAETPNASKSPTQTPAAQALNEFVRSRFRELATDRTGEDWVWYRSGGFNIGQQWWTKDGSTGRNRPMTNDDFNGWTAPVSDYFSHTIAANANALGAVLPRVTALSGNWDARSRRAAAYAEAVMDTANRESGMDILNPILAQQDALWGVGITKDSVAFDRASEDIPIIAQQTPLGTQEQPGQQPQLPAPASPQPQNGQQDLPGDAPKPSQPTGPSSQQGVPPEQLGDDEPQVVGSERIPAPRLKTTLPSPFAVYIPRDCTDPNMSPETYERCPYTLGEAREAFPDYAEALSADGTGDSSTSDSSYANSTSSSLSALYQAQLRRMSLLVGTTGNLGNKGADSETTVQYLTAIEGWIDWARLPKKAQQAIEAEWGDQPSEIDDYSQRGMSKLSAAVAFGIFAIVWQDLTLQWGENPNHGDHPYTWFLWEKNALNPYGKGGLGTVLVPLQRQLNKLDAIHDRQMMSTGTTKILMPESQQYKRPPGDPVDVWEYDDAVGKHAPQIIPAGNAGGIPAKRAQIVQEFQMLGYNSDVSTGNSPGGVDSFRGIAYLGAKADEQRQTQRALWEQAHERRARKLLRMAKRVWTEPRKIKVAGGNNKYGAELIEAADIDFETDQITIIEGSSRPKTLSEKEEAINTLIQGGLLDSTDVTTRDYIYDLIGMPELDLANELQYAKADRDLQQVLNGMQPVSSPFQDWSIVIKTFANYSLTEEFESLDQPTQGAVLGYAQWAQELMQPPPGLPGIPPGPNVPRGTFGPGGPFAGALPAAHPSQTLSKTKAPPKASQDAAQSQGQAIADSVSSTAAPFHT